MFERANAVVRVRRARFYVIERRGRLHVEDDVVHLDGERVARRGDIRHAYTVYERGRTLVRLTRSRAFGGDVDVEVDSAEEGDRLVAALRLDGARSVGEYTLTDGSLRVGRMRLAIKVLGILFFLAMSELLLFRAARGHDAMLHLLAPTMYFLATIGFAIGTASRAVHASVGADGVRLRRLAGTRFIPFADVAYVRLLGREIELGLRDGSKTVVHYAPEHRYEAEMLVERIEGQRTSQRVRAQAAKAPDADFLARHGRTAEEWMRAAETQHERNATFRTSVVPGERLWEIVEDSAAPATARAGAALALRHELDGVARMRLRIAAEACADPRTRSALESLAAAKQDSAILRALEPLEDATPAHARS
ncbi:MAG: hypothetical protein KIT84_03290 [Labilithrix sp.]|nr:hypothetical protein [Labilithrix sp.]MCW5810007.1 hypothetical protein [Labilithrix sp.]